MLQKSRIAIVIAQKFEPNEGGVQKSTAKLATIFRSLGMEVMILSTAKGEVDSFIDKSVKYLGIETKAGYNKPMADALKNNNIDIVVNQMGYSTRMTSLIRKSGGKQVKLVNTLRINPLNFIQNRGTFLRRYLENRNIGFLYFKSLLAPLKWCHRVKQHLNHKYVLKYVDAYVLLNGNFIPELSYFWINTEKYKKKLFAIPNPFQEPTEPMDLRCKDNVILFVGRLNITQKRVDLLMEVWKRIHQKLPDWQFWVVGDGPKREMMQEFCNENKLDRVHFFGFDDPEPYYRKAKILHFTSAFEGFGNVLVEAQQYGVVPILFDSYSAAKDIVWNDRTGLLIPPFDIEEYCKRTIQLIEQSEEWHRLSENSINDVERFNFEHIGSKWLELFRSLEIKNIR